MPVANTEADLWRHVTPVGDCLEFTGNIKNHGYGVFTVRGREWRAHRLSWTLLRGPIPEGLMVCHTCDNRRCVRIEHLFLGTDLDNVQDMVAKGRKVAGISKSMGTANGSSKLDETKVRQIRALAAEGVTQGQIAHQFGISRAQARKVIQRRYWAHVI